MGFENLRNGKVATAAIVFFFVFNILFALWIENSERTEKPKTTETKSEKVESYEL